MGQKIRECSSDSWWSRERHDWRCRVRYVNIEAKADVCHAAGGSSGCLNCWRNRSAEKVGDTPPSAIGIPSTDINLHRSTPHSLPTSPAYLPAAQRQSDLHRSGQAYPPACALTNTMPSTSSTSTTLKRAHSPSADENIFTSEPIHDRSSTFTGYFSPTLPPLDLQSSPLFSSASHKILAYRLPSSSPESSSSKKPRQTTLTPGGGALKTGRDDDGEQHGSRHVLRVLEDTATVGSVVVARWYGGVMLGPVRFEHMREAARGAIEAWRRGQSKVVEEKRRRDEEEREREELIRELRARDGNIESLRVLLEGKKGTMAVMEGQSLMQEGGQKSPAKKMDYEGMTIERLRMVDRARDGTVAFLLKQIDAVEEKIRSWEDLFDAKDGEDEEESKDKDEHDSERNDEDDGDDKEKNEAGSNDKQ